MADTWIIPNEGKVADMDVLRANYNSSGLTMRLIKATFALSNALVWADVSADEADFSGYAAPTIQAWNTAGVAANKGRSIEAAHVFTKSGATGNTIYGWVATDVNSKIRMAWLYETPVAMTADGSQLVVFPARTQDHE